MKKNISVLLVIACMITSNVSFVTVSSAEENKAATIDETTIAGDNGAEGAEILQEEQPETDNSSESIKEDGTSDIQSAENVGEEQDNPIPEGDIYENSWRYENGELIPQTQVYARRARAASNPNAWKKINGQYVNNLGNAIPGARKKGVDVSEHQGIIDWTKAKNDGIEYAIIRCSVTYYSSFYKKNITREDKYWKRNAAECERLGIPYGVYFYSLATNDTMAAEETQYALNLVAGHKLTYPIYFDMEDTGMLNGTNGVTRGSMAATFANKVSAAGYNAGIYANLNWWNNYLTSSVFGNTSWSKWIAQYHSRCQYSAPYDMWQCSSTGSVDGISGNVDLNFWMTDAPKTNSDEEQVAVTDENIITYTSHVQSYGWLDSVNNGYQTGKTGLGKRIEAFKINVGQGYGDLGVSYQACVQDDGWQAAVGTGATAGTEGKSKYIQAVKISLTGTQAANYDIYYRVHSQTFGWLGWASNGQPAGSQGYDKRIEAMQIAILPKGTTAPGSTDNAYKSSETKIEYKTYVENHGWKEYSADGNQNGTTGQAKAVQALAARVNDTQYSGDIVYDTYMQSYGWTGQKSNNVTAGLPNGGKRMEAIKVSLTGELAEHYDIYYRTYTQSYGWLDWAKNGESAGTKDFAKRIEAVQMKLVQKGGTAPGATSTAFKQAKLAYKSHVQTYGWQSKVHDGETSGTSGKAKRLEAINISMLDAGQNHNIRYKTHVQSYGWQNWVNGGVNSGTSGKAKRLEAIQIELKGSLASQYDIYYRVHAQTYGWLGWAKNGEKSGTEGLAKRLEAIQIILVEKGGKAPGSTARTFIKK